MKTFAYILSPHYSGSTLLTFLLANHPEVATIGELKASALGPVEDYTCSCGDPIRACPFWRRVTDELATRGVAFDVADFGTHFRAGQRTLTDRALRARVRGPAFEAVRGLALHLLPGAASAFHTTLQRNLTLADVVMRIQGGTVFLDGSKDPVRLKYFLQTGVPNVHVIYMIRDGRAVANSDMRRNHVSMESAARDWRRTHEECERLLARLPASRYVTIHYEQLCREPDQTLERLGRFLGLNPPSISTCLSCREQHVLGNPMRLRSGDAIQLDQKWRSALGPAELAVFERVAGDLNRRYGYDQ
jgi:hypothetical protein